MASALHLVPELGSDGLAIEPPVIAYTEKVLEAKELELKKYIEDNYSKIRNVEKEFASLALEIKLTAGPKKAALEHLRKKIEVSAERIKAAKQREEQAKKVWEAAAKAAKEEEDYKQRLCEDLNRLVQESAASQYSRLEDLKKKLEALNPELTGGAALSTGIEKEVPAATLQALPKEESPSHTVMGETAKKVTDSFGGSKPVTEGVVAESGALNGNKPSHPQQVSSGESLSRNSINRPARRGTLVKGGLGQKAKANSWTGAGFDVDDRAEAYNH